MNDNEIETLDAMMTAIESLEKRISSIEILQKLTLEMLTHINSTNNPQVKK